jgi:hypothetical protein
MRTYYVTVVNVENLFDEENAVALGRQTDKVFRAIKDDVAGWTTGVCGPCTSRTCWWR